MAEHTTVLKKVGDSALALDAAKVAYDVAAGAMKTASATYEAALTAVKAARAELDAHLDARVK